MQLAVGLRPWRLFFFGTALAGYFREPRAQSVIEGFSIACLLPPLPHLRIYLRSAILTFVLVDLTK
jgi:hypothetical protein